MGSSVGTTAKAYGMRSFYVSFQSTIRYSSCSAVRTRICQGGVGHVSFMDRCSVSRGARIALREHASEIRQSTDTTRMPPLKGNAILVTSVLFYQKKLDFR